jgi:hypothetical protein
MPQLLPKNFYTGNATAANVYTVGTTATFYSIIKNINICNTSNAANATASIHLLTAGAVPSNDNKIISNALIILADVLYYNTSIVVPANTKIYVSSSSSALTFSISGVEYA